MALKDHPAIVASVLSAALIAARLLAIARFDVSTAATILQVSGMATAVAGTAITLLPFALVLATSVLALAVFVDDHLLAVPPGTARTAFTLVFVATLCLTALPLALLAALMVMSAAILGRYLRSHHPGLSLRKVVASHRLLRAQVATLFVVVALAPIVLQRPWLPVQAVIFEDGTTTVGYVLGDAAGELALMSEEDRSIHFLDPDDIADRYICSAPPATSGVSRQMPQLELRGSVLGSLMWGDQTPSYPRCPLNDGDPSAVGENNEGHGARGGELSAGSS